MCRGLDLPSLRPVGCRQRSEGVVVTKVDPNGLAAEHGFQTGDIILEVGGKKVSSPADVRTALNERRRRASARC